MRVLLLAASLALPLAAAAQEEAMPWAGGNQDSLPDGAARTPEEFGQRFDAAVSAFYLPGAEAAMPADLLHDDVVEAILPGIEGLWLRGAMALRIDGAPPRDDHVVTGCRVMGVELSRTTPRSFEIRVRIPGDDPAASFVERYDFVAGNTFLHSVEEEGFLRRLLGPEERWDEMAPGRIEETLTSSHPGEVILLHPSYELLVLLQPRRPADIWVRCP